MLNLGRFSANATRAVSQQMHFLARDRPLLESGSSLAGDYKMLVISEQLILLLA